MKRIILSIAAGLALIGLLGWLGLRIRPGAFAAIGHQQPTPDTVPLPPGLPAPVERFYRKRYGDSIPVVKTAIITGRGTIRPLINGPRLPIRFRFTHEAGINYRHYIEATFFGLPIMKVNEYYVNGRERMEMPWGVSENNPKLDQGGALGMWAEAMNWLPSILITDPTVRWEAIDDTTAWLIVPFEQTKERFLVRFNPATDEVQYLEAMRYQNGEGGKMLWINGAWFDQGSPWAAFNVEEIVYNAPVDVSMTAKGP